MIMKKTGSIMTVFMEVRVKITPLLKGAMNDEGASYQELLLRIMKETGSMQTVCMD